MESKLMKTYFSVDKHVGRFIGYSVAALSTAVSLRHTSYLWTFSSEQSWIRKRIREMYREAQKRLHS